MVEKLSLNYLDMNYKKTVQNIESLIWLYLTFNKDIDWLLNRHIFQACIEGKYPTLSTTTKSIWSCMVIVYVLLYRIPSVNVPPLKFGQQLKRTALPRQELSEFEMLVYRNWVSDTCIASTLKTFGIVQNSWPHFNVRPIDIVKLKKSNGFCMVGPFSTWHCQVEKVKWVCMGCDGWKGKGVGKYFQSKKALLCTEYKRGAVLGKNIKEI